MASIIFCMKKIFVSGTLAAVQRLKISILFFLFVALCVLYIYMFLLVSFNTCLVTCNIKKLEFDLDCCL